MNRTLLVFSVVIAAWALSWMGNRTSQPARDSSFTGFTTRPTQEQFSERFVRSDLVDVIRHPTEVQAYRLDEHSQKLEEGRFASGPIDVSPAIATKFGRLITDPNSYYTSSTMCTPFYGVRLSYRRGGRVVDINVCFRCKTLTVVADGQVTGGGYFLPRADNLLKLVQRAFPDDVELQKLDIRSL